MKKLISLQAVMLMSLAVGSTSLMQADEECAQNKMKTERRSKREESGKEMMKKIEREFHKIKMRFEKDHDKQTALEKLDRMPERIKKCVELLKSEEKSGRIYRTHERTLNRKLDGLRRYIKEHAKEGKEVRKSKEARESQE